MTSEEFADYVISKTKQVIEFKAIDMPLFDAPIVYMVCA
jgi:hypothetical protein